MIDHSSSGSNSWSLLELITERNDDAGGRPRDLRHVRRDHWHGWCEYCWSGISYAILTVVAQRGLQNRVRPSAIYGKMVGIKWRQLLMLAKLRKKQTTSAVDGNIFNAEFFVFVI